VARTFEFRVKAELRIEKSQSDRHVCQSFVYFVSRLLWEAKTKVTQATKTGLGHLIQGIQHTGITVSDMAKSLEFYTEVLGGKLVVGETGLQGDTIQNTLFQREELEAIAESIPNLRDGKTALDVRFISFGNTHVELIHFRDASLETNSPTLVSTNASHIGHVNSMHLSFHVKEDIDLNMFAQLLEQECQARGFTNVIFNRIVRVNSEEERRQIALNSNSFKFWHEFEDREPKEDFGAFEGWSLFYCKGPNGEQLEFNQVTRNVKVLFKQGQAEYNKANNNSFSSEA
jgi:catechol 2,3-dioxygenase-like lactoylglutathione lyase family enzyme